MSRHQGLFKQVTAEFVQYGSRPRLFQCMQLFLLFLLLR
jgi:hypothetical protein